MAATKTNREHYMILQLSKYAKSIKENKITSRSDLFSFFLSLSHSHSSLDWVCENCSFCKRKIKSIFFTTSKKNFAKLFVFLREFYFHMTTGNRYGKAKKQQKIYKFKKKTNRHFSSFPFPFSCVPFSNRFLFAAHAHFLLLLFGYVCAFADSHIKIIHTQRYLNRQTIHEN